jgi:hypothetical protein
MPSQQLLDDIDTLKNDHRVLLVTEVFQSDDQNIDGGVCRGITAKWIGNMAFSQVGLDQFRSLAEYKGGKISSVFVSYQKAFNIVSNEQMKARGEARKLANKARELNEKRKGTRSVGLFERRPSDTDVGSAVHYLQKYVGRELRAATDMFMRYLGGGIVMLNREGEETYNIFKLAPSNTLVKQGVYYVGLGRTHAIGFRTSNGQCMFFDANTGEWAVESRVVLDAFFSDYMDKVYGNAYAGKNVTYYYTPLTLPVEDFEFSGLEPLFASLFN